MRVFVALLVALLAFAPAQAETRWSLVRSYPHDDKAFTQGLIWLDGALYESTGQYGASNLREVRLEDGAVQRSVPLSPRYFGEGLTHWGDALISITWRNGIGFRWDRATFREVATFRYAGEGWGLANDGTRLILSDGSAELRFLDPVTLEETGRLPVTHNSKPVPMLNELEYVKGEILANIWMTDRIARIDPATGQVIDWIDISRLTRKQRLTNPDAVPNGIAYDAANDRLFVTGKYWPKLYEIRLKR
ncbi:MAG: glutaminyl-peptide cyclotransferase [Sphingobium sp.]|nr:glutaminyl-peptide cyclotransferase [Sphingobium sp.]MBP6112670.1 glutaminyl-peptide cyclotransferase [Sphingobium sp.]MBP8670561.1 glutaminyl-peptide cyclotransferase [Sphingobium sp.]MBP9157642.1 glutaminyl-peptide cyclotransferase [Sphingobium sp.]MCC6481234.1 glutaminyl-peptide cyclotransferase [Sphingomonadaceae bacterium]